MTSSFVFRLHSCSTRWFVENLKMLFSLQFTSTILCSKRPEPETWVSGTERHFPFEAFILPLLLCFYFLCLLETSELCSFIAQQGFSQVLAFSGHQPSSFLPGFSFSEEFLWRHLLSSEWDLKDLFRLESLVEQSLNFHSPKNSKNAWGSESNLHEFCGIDQVLLQHLLSEAPHGAVELVCSLTVLDPPEHNHEDAIKKIQSIKRYI